MIIHQLIARHWWHRDDPDFYRLQAADSVGWLRRHGVALGSATRALDLGCGHGLLGAALARCGCLVEFADLTNQLHPSLAACRFHVFDINRDELDGLGQFDLVVCSNVFEHLACGPRFLATAHRLLAPQGRLYLSWTNWLSPWGGHEFSPWHYFGPRYGHRIHDWLGRRPRVHTPYENLFPTHIGAVLKTLRRNSQLTLLRAAPRYYPEFSLLTRIPLLREFLTWNCVLLLGRNSPAPKGLPSRREPSTPVQRAESAIMTCPPISSE